MIKMLKHNMSIHCDTLEKSEKFIEYIKSQKYIWHGFSLFGYTCWDNYKEDTCYCLSDSGNSIQYSGLDYFKENGYEIIEFEKFMKSAD
jgi:hypothetical protein